MLFGFEHDDFASAHRQFARDREAYHAADKLTKTTWCVILGFGVVLTFIPVGGLFMSLVTTIAAFVYLADVRPALANLTRR